jgi:hypothetical protein
MSVLSKVTALNLLQIGNPTEWSISLSKDVNDDLKVSLALLDSASFSEEGQNEVYASLITWITTKPEYRGDEDDGNILYAHFNLTRNLSHIYT